MLSSWQTTISGVLLIVLGMAHMYFISRVDTFGGAMIVAGIGLVTSKDHNK
jgi:hypothetical protein